MMKRNQIVTEVYNTPNCVKMRKKRTKGMESRKKLAKIVARATEERFDPEALDLLQQASEAAEHHDDVHDAKIGELMRKALAMAPNPGPRIDALLDSVTKAWLKSSGGCRRPRPQSAVQGKCQEVHHNRRRARAEVVFCSSGGASLVEVSSIGGLRSFLPPTGGLIILVEDPHDPVAQEILRSDIQGSVSQNPGI